MSTLLQFGQQLFINLLRKTGPTKRCKLKLFQVYTKQFTQFTQITNNFARSIEKATYRINIHSLSLNSKPGEQGILNVKLTWSRHCTPPLRAKNSVTFGNGSYLHTIHFSVASVSKWYHYMNELYLLLVESFAWAGFVLFCSLCKWLCSIKLWIACICESESKCAAIFPGKLSL